MKGQANKVIVGVFQKPLARMTPILPKAMNMEPSYQSSRSIWTTLQTYGLEIWVVLDGARSWTLRSLSVPSNLGYSMILTCSQFKTYLSYQTYALVT